MAQSNRIASIVSGIAVIVGAIVFGLIWAGQRSMLGTPYNFSPNETVNYAGTATEAEARALATELERAGFFDGTHEADVLINKSDEGTVLSFVTNHQGHTDPQMLTDFQALAERVAYTIGGTPFTLRLLDEKLNTKQEFKIESSRWGAPVEINPGEVVHYVAPITEEEAKKLGEVLKQVNFFNGKQAKDVFMRKAEKGLILSFVTAEEAHTSEQYEVIFRGLGQQIADAIGASPLTIHMIDESLEVKKEIVIE